MDEQLPLSSPAAFSSALFRFTPFSPSSSRFSAAYTRSALTMTTSAWNSLPDSSRTPMARSRDGERRTLDTGALKCVWVSGNFSLRILRSADGTLQSQKRERIRCRAEKAPRREAEKNALPEPSTRVPDTLRQLSVLQQRVRPRCVVRRHALYCMR